MRQGLNCTLSYVHGTVTHTYRVRAGQLGSGVDMVYAEDQARTQRAYYPHRTANQQFAVQILLKNWDERSSLVSWMVNYASYMLDANQVRGSFPFMQVNCPVRNFSQQGVPLSGYEWGAHAGMMAFAPVFIFEAAQSPGQVANSVTASSVTGLTSAYASSPAVKYFYPFSTQLQANQVPVDYGTVLPPSPTPPLPTGPGRVPPGPPAGT